MREVVLDTDILPIETEEAVLAGQISAMAPKPRRPKIGELDSFIAATAIQYKRPLVTNNLKHYQRIIKLGFELEIETRREV